MGVQVIVTADQYHQITELRDMLLGVFFDDQPQERDEAWILGIKNILGIELAPMQDLDLIVETSE